MMTVIIIAVHLVCITLLAALWKNGRLKVHLTALISMLMIPIVGEICILVMHLFSLRGFEGQKAGEVDEMFGEHSRASVYRQNQNENDRSAVPLEDALILGDSGTRREAMMDVLMDPSVSSMTTIRRAKKNSDTEVVHYATTAMTEASKQYDLRLQKANTDYQKDPGSDRALDRYIFVLKSYLDDDMAEGELLEIQRTQYQKLLRERIQRHHERDDFADLAGSLMDSRMYEDADRILSIMEKHWLHWNRTLNLRLRYYYETGNGSAIRRLLEKVQSEPYHPADLDDEIRFWTAGEDSHK